ncbi:MAG: hypothetical protein ACTSRC_19410 [Candidatus Helarchaeota archaeon]
MLSKDELHAKLESYELILVVDDFFGTTIHTSAPENFGYLGIAYKTVNNILKAIVWKRHPSQQYQVSLEFKEAPFKIHAKWEDTIASVTPKFKDFPKKERGI